METAAPRDKQNITLRLSRQTIQKARVIAAKRSTSISGLLSQELERLAAEDNAYARAQARAFAMMEKGFDLGGAHHLDRDALHER
ncbi:MAG: hypothetical protein ACRD3N_07315 [Terracidiphilus sp.]